MAQISETFVKGRMNKSVDERLVPLGEYVDALNVRLGSTETTEIGAVENSKGNSRLTTLEYAGAPLTDNARTIGCFEDGVEETIYWFVHDEQNPNSPTGVVDMIVSFNTNTSALVYHVISTSVLNFNFSNLITGVSKLENLLFFTDNFNPPRGINVNKSPGYAYPVGGIDTVLEEEDLNVIVKPPGFEDYDAAAGQVAPLGCPHIELIKLPTEENYMETRFLSFAYRYRYENGQYSATSLFSDPAFEPQTFQLSIQNFWNEGMQNEYNACNITFSTGSRRVTEIQLLYKEATSNVIYVIKRYDKVESGWADNSFETVQFTNSEIYTTLGSDELLRLYDNVPRFAKAQTIQGNRLIYGNYVEGYDIRSGSKTGPLIEMDYYAEPLSLQTAGTQIGGNSSNPNLFPGNYDLPANLASVPIGAVTTPDSKIIFSLSSFFNGIDIEPGDTFFFNFEIVRSSVYPWSTTPGGDPTSTFNIEFKYTAEQYFTNVNNMLSSQSFKNAIGGSITEGFTDSYAQTQELYPCNNSNQGGTLSDKFYTAALENIQLTQPDAILVGGGVDGGFCNPPLSLQGTPPGGAFPVPCNTQVLFQGMTQTPPSILPPTPGLLYDQSAPFLSNTPPILVGYLVVNLNTLEIAEIGQIDSDSTIILNDINTNSFAGLTQPNVPFQIIIGGGNSQQCFPDGIKIENNMVGQLRLTLPAVRAGYWYQGVSLNFTYYTFAFKQFGCTLFYKKDVTSGSLHSNRDYEVGVVYMDDYGRSSTVLTSNNNTVYFPPNTSVYKNKIKVTLDNLPPYWATKYKFVVKPSQGEYNTIFSNIFYQQDGSGSAAIPTALPVATTNDPSLTWFRLDGQNANIVQVGDQLTLKQDIDGPIFTESISVVLAVQAFSGGGIRSNSLAGLYMLLKASGWNSTPPPDSYIYPGLYKDKADDNGQLCIKDYPLNDSSGLPYTIPAGATITINIKVERGGNKCYAKLTYNRTFIASQDYANFHAWAIGDNLPNQMTTNSNNTFTEGGDFTPNGLALYFDPTLVPQGSNPCFTFDNKDVKVSISQDGPGDPMFFCVTSGLTKCSEFNGGDTGKFPAYLDVEVQVTRTRGTFVFETQPQESDPNLFYDASDLLDIKPIIPGDQAYHKAKQDFFPTTQTYALNPFGLNQTNVNSLVTVLDAYNCYTFGNGIESYKIYDSPVGKSFNLGERVLAVSNQDFKEAHRFASLTYSGIYTNSTNVNNLNEFNLGLVNFKDCETVFGSIEKLHARQTDILTLQEDRITYVLADKTLISDATGGGAIVSTPSVLGKQIARIEEYGISFNPESFIAWGSDMFFTDAKRGAVINLRGATQGSDQLQVISSLGMNSWFRDTFNKQLNTQKLGAYDPYMKEYVLSTNLNAIRTEDSTVPCGQTISQINSEVVMNYDVPLGPYTGTVDIPYTVTAGSVDISITFNNIQVASVTGATVSGSLSFTKNLTNPTFCDVVITPNEPSTYSVTVECVQQVTISVVEVVLNSPNYNGETIHVDYKWSDGTTTSPYAQNAFSPIVLQTTQPSGYQITTGYRASGVFPYDGTDITMRVQQIPPDTFTFIPTMHKFRILSSNTYYSNSAADIASLVAASSEVSPITQPPLPSVPLPYQQTPTYFAVETAMNIPIGNQYLYLIYDFTQVTQQQVCYCPTTDTVQDVCCNCLQICKNVLLGPVSPSAAAACTTDVDSPGAPLGTTYFGNGGIPSIGDVVYEQKCSPDMPMPQGFYITSPTGVSPSLPPKKWIEIDNTGVVVNSGTC